ncbi:MAG TPA: protein kinase, partial [Gemmatimonadales bacterium]|nr:protein kinase [Gemmatimonadales bacterium]
VTDFGVAKAVSASSGSSSLTSLGVALGTPAYMAPEQAAADPHVDHRADIYAVGIMGWEMLAGRIPFSAPTAQGMLAAHITQIPEPVAKVRPAVSPALNGVLMRCLEKRAADRWQSAAELLGQLEAAVTPSGGQAPTVATAAVSSGTEEAIRRSHPARVALLFAAASAGVLGLVWVLVHRLGLPDWVLTGAVVLLLIGLPIMLVTGSIERRRARARASGRVATTPASGLQGWLTWRKAVRGGVLAFAGLGLATVAYTAMRALGIGPVGTLVASGRLSERDRLIVADFENRTADSSLGTSVSEAFRIDLAQTPLVRILSSAEVGDALTRMRRDPATPVTLALAREIATREGAKAIVTGEISALGKSYVVSARILGADGSELVALRETAEDDARIVGALDRLSAKLRERIGESLTSIRAGAPLEQVTTSSLEALRLYTEGARLSDQGYEQQAVDRLEQAIALDSGFAMAWRKLAVAQGNASGSEERVVGATTRAWQHRERLTEVERLLTEGFYHSRVEVDPAKEEAAYRRILAINPDNKTAANNLSLLLSRLGRAEEAESVITPAIRASASPDNMMLQLMLAQLLQGHDAEARRTLDTMAAIGPDLAMYVWARGIALGAMGDYDGAERAFLDLERRTSEADLGDVSDAHQGLARVARIRGRLADADRHTRLDMEVSARRGLPGTVLQGAADLARAELTYRGDSAGAIRILEAALADHPLDSVPALDRPSAHVAMVYALAGRKERARQLLSAYESQVPEGVRRGRWEWYLARGWLALAEGQPREAAGNFVQGRHSDDCYFCGGWDEGVAYERAGMADSALAAYERAVGRGGPWRMRASQWGLGPSLKRLAELHEARGDRARALGYYGRFVELWKDADPVLQPAVREVRGRMAALAGEGE